MSDAMQRSAVPVVVANIVIFAVVGLDLYWLFTESGPMGWLASLEAQIFRGHWYPKITLLALLLLEIGLALAVMGAADRVNRLRRRSRA